MKKEESNNCFTSLSLSLSLSLRTEKTLVEYVILHGYGGQPKLNF